MKITLISTLTFPSDQGLRTISSVLKKAGHSVKIIFMSYSEDYSKFYSKNELNQLYYLCKKSDLIGISSYVSTEPRAIQIINFLNQKKIKTPIIWGGVHATLFPEKCIKHSDMVCIGEGEKAILELANALEKDKDIKKIKNIWIKDSKTKEIIKNPVRPALEKIDELPFADYDLQNHYLLENNHLRKFKEEDLGGQIFFLTGRGCPYGCAYCSNNFLNKIYEGKTKKIVRWHSIDYIIECILDLKSRFPSLSYFDIRDDTFSLRPISQIKEFCEKYKQKIGLRFKCLGDPKTITEEKIKLLVDAGCTDIIIGIQAIEKTNKEIFKRNQTNQDVLNSSKILNKYKNKLAVMYDIITCNPYEDAEDIEKTIRLLQKLPKPYFLSVNNLVFFPGNQLYQKAIQDSKTRDIALKSSSLNYWDRTKHIKLKKKNQYLVLILNMMRGSVTESRFGMIPNFIINFLLKPSRIKKNLKNPFLTNILLYFVWFLDLIRERVAKPFYRSMPVSFKVWYDKIRYRV